MTLLKHVACFIGLVVTSDIKSIEDALRNMEGSMKLFMNETELAERWEISVRTLQGYRYRDKGLPLQKMKGPPWVTIGGSVRYRREDVLAFENRNSAWGSEK